VCGICGKLNFDREARVSPELLKSMADTIYHRGPDDEGFYASGPIGLGFRRLSIIDLNTGHQPISNEDGSVWIVFNGEIYNYQELREFLVSKGHVFSTKTDTEVIVHLYEEFGPQCVQKLRGMFGFAIWDKRQQSLFLARDRVGIKPIYYWLSEKTLTFGSEIKAVLADPDVHAEIHPEIIDRFLTFLYVPGEETLIRNLRKLAPGSYLYARNGKVEIKEYWDLNFNPTAIKFADAEKQFLDLMEESVGLHMISDVPVGFLLSGGVDSTAMLGFAVGKTNRPLSSFTLGFSEPGIVDERPYAAMAAKRYGSDHHEMTITSREFADFLPQFAWHMEEPCCEPQAVALYYISKLARQYVKVLISGEGGDEALAGYSVYRNMMWLERAKHMLGPLNGAAASGVSFLNGFVKSKRMSKYPPLFNLTPEQYYFSRTASPASYFNSESAGLYTADFACSVDKEQSLSVVTRYLRKDPGMGYVNRMLYVDTKTSLPDDLLLKADKMTMANSIELRVPLLDHKVLEFAASLPENYKVHNFTTKYLAKEALKDRLPREILERKKVGFPVPFSSWLRNELKGWVRGVLLDPSALSRGYFTQAGIENLLQRDSQMQGTGMSKEILSLISLELWHRSFLEHRATTPPEPIFTHAH
jgi:asparagine synthase (glutamine-hydrolysing)